MPPKASENPACPGGAHAGLRIDAGVTVLVVGRALLRVGENFVGFLDFLEVLLGLGVVRIAIRMIFHRQLAVSLLDFIIGGVAIDAQNVVKVAFCHGFLNT
jgi:hypothetical protein